MMAVFEQLATLLGDRFSTAMAVRQLAAGSETFHHSGPPDAVAFPRTTQEVSEILRLCHGAGVPVTARGAGTSLEGHALTPQGGLTLDLTQMDRVVEVLPEDMLAVVQPGVTREALNTELRATGLFFPVDPGANASLGGMASTRASGTTTVRYGSMRDNVAALEVVLADGRVIRTGSRAAKSAAGYDLTALMLGAEGTLGIITELTLRLHGQPEEVATAICGFDDFAAAVDCVIATIQSGVQMARIEFTDEDAARAFNQYAKADFPERPHLLVEFHGTPESVAAEVARFRELAEDFGAVGFEFATTTEARAALWKMRHGAYPAILALRPGATGLVTDACVPISHLAEAVAETRADIAAEGLLGPIIGHVGDGNFHAILLIDPDNPDHLAAAKRVADRLAARAQRLGGTMTGEHGVGMGKRHLMADEHGEGWAVMGAIKAALDPKGILNPGKLIP